MKRVPSERESGSSQFCRFALYCTYINKSCCSTLCRHSAAVGNVFVLKFRRLQHRSQCVSFRPKQVLSCKERIQRIPSFISHPVPHISLLLLYFFPFHFLFLFLSLFIFTVPFVIYLLHILLIIILLSVISLILLSSYSKLRSTFMTGILKLKFFMNRDQYVVSERH